MAIQLSKAEKKQLNSIYADYALTRDNIFIDEKTGFKIINRSGIGLMKKMLMADIKYELVHQHMDSATIHGKGFAQNAPTAQVIVGMQVEDFGEASPQNNTFQYPVAVAKKRCESRIVLELAGLYGEGYRGQDETDHQPEKKLSKSGEKAVNATIEAIDKRRPQTNTA